MSRRSQSRLEVLSKLRHPDTTPLDSGSRLMELHLRADERRPASWTSLPNELQLQVLGYLLLTHTPVTQAMHRDNPTFRTLLTVDKKMALQARHLYCLNTFTLYHGLYHIASSVHKIEVPWEIWDPAFEVLRHPLPRFCEGLKSLELIVFPKSIRGDLLQGQSSWAPFFIERPSTRTSKSWRHRVHQSEPHTKWQASLTNLKHLKVTFDFSYTFEQYDGIPQVFVPQIFGDPGGACMADHRSKFIDLLNNEYETAFPCLTTVDVTVRHLYCYGYAGTWSRELGLPRGTLTESPCRLRCPETMGLALEAALSRPATKLSGPDSIDESKKDKNEL